MSVKKHNIVYKTTNTLTGKYYIGRHSTDDLNDGYIGSGKDLLKDVKIYGKDNFVREVLFDYENPADMISKEKEFLTKEFVLSEDNYNVNLGTGGFLDEERRKNMSKLLREANLGLVTVKDENGNNIRIRKDDPRYVSGELKFMLSGKISLKDSDGNQIFTDLDDPRYLSGELVSINVGIKRPVEVVEKHIEFMKEYWKDHSHSDEAIEKMREVNEGKVTVKDKDGKLFRVSIDDERIKSGELTYMWVGKKHTETAKEKISKEKKGNVWIANYELNTSKLIKPEAAIPYLESGWEYGRIYYKELKTKKRKTKQKS